MLTHAQVWIAIEALARKRGLTVSGLARKAGLDPTTFNRSKRVGGDGRLRWPSTESLAKVLDATGVSLDDFLRLLRDNPAGPEAVYGGFDEPSRENYESAPLRDITESWNWEGFPLVSREQMRVLEVVDDSLLPVFRAGAVLLTSSGLDLMPGDRVVVETRPGLLLGREFVRRSRRGLELRGWSMALPDMTLAAKDIAWTAKILWSSQ